MRLEDKYRAMTPEEMEKERQEMEERDERHARWHPALGPQCGGGCGAENDAYKL